MKIIKKEICLVNPSNGRKMIVETDASGKYTEYTGNMLEDTFLIRGIPFLSKTPWFMFSKLKYPQANFAPPFIISNYSHLLEKNLVTIILKKKTRFTFTVE